MKKLMLKPQEKLIIVFIYGMLSDFFNQFIQIKFSLLTLNVICSFLSPNINQKVCGIVYGPGNNHSDCANTSLNMRSENGTGLSSVAIKLLEFPQHHLPQNRFCFMITASDGVFTMQVAGTFNAGIYSYWFMTLCGTH